MCACRTTGESFAVGIGSTVKVRLTCGAVPEERRGLLSHSWAAVSSLVLQRPWIPCQARTFSAEPCLLGGVPSDGLFWGRGAGISPTTVPQGSVTEGCLTCERAGWFSKPSITS